MQLLRCAVYCVLLVYQPIVVAVNGAGNDSGVELLIETPLGKLKGSIMKSSEDKSFLAFRGIPYAQPPLGSLRFNDPVPGNPWEGIWDATKEAPACLQYEILTDVYFGQEDCLYLNVYTPNSSSDELLPVLIWIHGGAWLEGTGNGETFVFGPEYIMDENVVLVTINYRLSMFGFLSTEDIEAPGNYGLLDQIVALQWVHDHIQQFGGNPQKVTLFGESAGGAAVHYMMITPRTKGLFHGAISHSGTAMSSWAIIQNPRYYATELGKALKCDRASSKELLACLRKLGSMDIIQQHGLFQRPVGFFPIAFGPRVDRERQSPVVPDDPKNLLEQGRYHAVPWIAGVTKSEGTVMFAVLKAQDGIERIAQEPHEHLPYYLNYGDLSDKAAFTKKVLANYFKNQEITQDQTDQLIHAASDSIFNIGIWDAVRLHAKRNLHPIYVYQFSHRFNYTCLEFMGYQGQDFGATHTDDLLGLFHIPKRPYLDGKDKKVSKLMLKYWVNFAYSGNPNSESCQHDAVWHSFNDQSGYLDITAEPKFVKGNLNFADRAKLWSKLSVRDEL